MNTFKRVVSRREIAAGGFLLATFAMAALLAPILAPFDPYRQSLLFGLEAPTSSHLLGRDLLGRDVLSRLLFGARTSLFIGFAATMINIFSGTVIGGFAGMSDGWGGRLCLRIMDVAQAVPGLLLAILIMGVLGPGSNNLLVALCMTGWVAAARLARGQILSIREREFISAAIAAGAGRGRLLIFHFLPNMAAPLLIEATFSVGSTIIAEAGLSFLGLGIQPPESGWGSMLNEGRPYLLIAPHLMIAPGICLLLLVVAVNLVGEGLRDILSHDRKVNS